MHVEGTFVAAGWFAETALEGVTSPEVACTAVCAAACTRLCWWLCCARLSAASVLPGWHTQRTWLKVLAERLRNVMGGVTLE
jgi:hypothetical protein